MKKIGENGSEIRWINQGSYSLSIGKKNGAIIRMKSNGTIKESKPSRRRAKKWE